MKQNHHSLEYKKQKAPNKKYKDLKQKQKGMIADWMFADTCRYYHEFGGIPEGETAETIVWAIYHRLENLAIWVPFDEVLREYSKKLPHYEVRIQEKGIPEEVLNPKPPKEKPGKAAKSRQRHIKRSRNEEMENDWQDDNFFFIAGYTSGGAPYGVTWEEMGLEPWQELKDNSETE